MGMLKEFMFIIPIKLKQKYLDLYITYIIEWISFEFYNFECIGCGYINKTISINRIFQYTIHLNYCRVCHRRRFDSDNNETLSKAIEAKKHGNSSNNKQFQLFQQTGTYYTKYTSGVSINYTILNPKYDSLAQEILLNDIISMSQQSFNGFLQDSKQILRNKIDIIPKSTEFNRNFGICKNDFIGICHLIVVRLYTSKQHFASKFNETYWHWKDNNLFCNNFYWFGRFLHEAVYFFGQKFIHSRFKIKPLHHTLKTKMEFESFAPTIYFPAKTSAVKIGQGLVVSYAPKYIHSIDNTKCISICQWSGHDDNEWLFMGQSKIQIFSVQFDNKQFTSYNYAILYLEKIFTQTIYDYQYYNTIHNTLYLPAIRNTALNLIQNRLMIKSYHHIPKYIEKLFRYWCRNKRFITLETFSFESRFMSDEMKEFLKHDQNMLNLFPNLEQYCDVDGEIQYIEEKAPQFNYQKQNNSSNLPYTENIESDPWVCMNCTYKNVPLMVNSLWRYYNIFNRCCLCDSNRLHILSAEQIQLNDKTINNLCAQIQKNASYGPCLFAVNDIMELSTDQLAHLLQNYIIDKLKEKLLKTYKCEIISYFTKNNMTGELFMNKMNGNQKNELRKQIWMHCKNQKINGLLPKIFEEIRNFDLKKVNHMKCAADDITYKQLLKHCPITKRINMILLHFEALTDKVSMKKNKYPYNMRTFLYALPKYMPAQLLNDIDHIIHHQPKDIIKCKSHNYCIHFERSLRIQSNENLYKDIQKQKKIFNCHNQNDVVYIDMLDRLHVLVKHSVNDHQTQEKHVRFRMDHVQFSNKNFGVGVYFEYFSLNPLYSNLCQELIKCREYHIALHQFKQQLDGAQEFMKTNNKILKTKANRTDKRYGIKKGYPISVQHILSIRVYCNFTQLCTAYRNCCNKIEHDDITYVKNYYWLGRFLTNAISFYGQETHKNEEIYNIIPSKCSFDSFSVIYQIPTSSTTVFDVAASQFANETGTILQLSAKYSHQPQVSTCFNVSTICSFTDENELLFCGMTTMTITNIYKYSNGKWQDYKPYVECCLYMERIIEQTIHTKEYYNHSIITANNEENWKRKHKDYLVPLLKHQILRTLSNFDIHNYTQEYTMTENSKIPQYVLKMFETFCDNRQDLIHLTHIMEEKNMHPSLHNMLFKTDKHIIEINNWIIASIFPNVKQYKDPQGNWISLPSLQLLSLTDFKELYNICTTNTIKRIDKNLGKYYKSKGRSTYFDGNGIGLFETFCKTNGFDNENVEDQLSMNSANKCSLVELDDNFPLEIGLRKDQRNAFILKILKQCNNNTLHIHKTVELECLIKSSSQSKKESKDKIIIPSDYDWNHNLQTIISYICKKYKMINNMNESNWCLKIKNINKVIQNKHNGKLFGELLSNIKGQVTIQIMDSINSSTDSLISDLQRTLKDEESKEEFKDESKWNGKLPVINTNETNFERSQNKQLSELNQNEFYEWVRKCMHDIPITKTIQNMRNCIVNSNLIAKVLVQHTNSRNNMKDFIHSKLQCNEVYFLEYFTTKVIEDSSKIINVHENNKVPFCNLGSIQLADYVQEKYYSFPVFAFRSADINGLEYCNKKDPFLIDLLQTKCGFKRDLTKFLIDKIDKYPVKSPQLSIRRYNPPPFPSPHKFSVTPHIRSEFDRQIGYNDGMGSTNLISNISSESQILTTPSMDIIDDELSDASDATESSKSYSFSIGNYNRPFRISKKPQIKAEQLFGQYAKKIYKGQNDRHFKRTEERLNRVGIEKVLPYMGSEEKKSDNYDLDDKYFKSQARLVYKIDVKVFYDGLYNDIMTRAFGFDVKFNRIDATKWLVKYELNKLYSVIVKNKITRTKFTQEMISKDKLFCDHYMEFLPKKRRKKLWQQLKKDVLKGKLNYIPM